LLHGKALLGGQLLYVGLPLLPTLAWRTLKFSVAVGWAETGAAGKEGLLIAFSLFISTIGCTSFSLPVIGLEAEAEGSTDGVLTAGEELSICPVAGSLVKILICKKTAVSFP
jgi:hypothetical protein